MTTISIYANTPKEGSGNVPLYPRFYMKNVGGKISIFHRYTHCYMECFDTEEEVAKELAEWNKFSQKDLWEYLLFERYAQLVKPMDFTKRYEHDEDWYHSAWGIYTARFFSKYPELFIEEIEMPYSVAYKVMQHAHNIQHENYKKAQKEREEASQRFEREEKTARKVTTEQPERIEIGNVEQIEKAQKKAKKIIVIKRKKGVQLKSPVVSDNPFD